MMPCVVGRRLVMFPQVSAFLPCWAVRWSAARAEPFARILHAREPVLTATNDYIAQRGARTTPWRVRPTVAASNRRGVAIGRRSG